MESFANNAIKRPFKLFMFCMVLYLAAQSIVVGAFLAIVGTSWLYHRFIAFASKTPAAPKVSTPEPAKRDKPPQAVVESAEKQYEHSAVVMSIRRTGTDRRS
ncbi:hypothetical protein [Cupriavidus basilensis]|uniref:hypothetical protein n=1 Tax=Cupriavidus basilensis TaxID=68895 RepID=UPI000750BE8C|nr:hypothetical protein [Cupriavidus basilensis]